MARPAKKSGVTVEQRRKWLRMVEEHGDSIAQIVNKEGYDPRTVSRHISLARQEQEAKEARVTYLRDAIRDHSAEVLQIAATLQTLVSKSESTTSIRPDRMYSALREHLYRSPLWKLLDAWENTQSEIVQARKNLREKTQEELKKDAALAEAFKSCTPDYENTTRLFAEQAEFWKIGGKGLSLDSNFHVERLESGQMLMKVGGYIIGSASQDREVRVRQALLDFRARFETLAEFQSLRDGYEALNKQAPEIDEELALIILKRVLPGRCKYCPA